VLPLLSWCLEADPLVVLVHALFGITIILRHRENIERLLAGVENKIGRKA